ncbi:MAG: hypothetical protein AB7G75_20120 [Candidatus Binatia bacterium]
MSAEWRAVRKRDFPTEQARCQLCGKVIHRKVDVIVDHTLTA